MNFISFLRRADYSPFPAKILCPLAILLAGMVSVFWFQGDTIIYWGDFIFPINRTLFWHQSFYAWLDISIGLDKLQSVGEMIPFGLFVYLSELAGLTVSAAQKIWMYGMFTGSGLAMYVLALAALREEKSRYAAALLAGLLYMFNPWTATHMAFLWQHMVFIPLALGLYIKGLNERRGVRYAIGFAIVLWLTSTTSITNMRAIALEFVFLALFFIYYLLTHRGEMKRVVKFSLFVAGIYLLLNFYIIVPLISNFSRIFSETGAAYQEINFTWLDAFTLNSARSGVESLRLLGSWALPAAHSGYPYYYWYPPYTNAFLMIVSFVLIAFAACLPLMLSKCIGSSARKMMFYFLAVFLLGLGISLGKNSAPVWFLASTVKFFSTLFSLPTFHGGTLQIIAFCVLYAFGYNAIYGLTRVFFQRVFVFAGFFALIAVYGFPVWSGRLIIRATQS